MKHNFIVTICSFLLLGSIYSPSLAQPKELSPLEQRIKERVSALSSEQKSQAIKGLSDRLQRIKQKFLEAPAGEQKDILQDELDRIAKELEFLKLADKKPEIIESLKKPASLPPPLTKMVPSEEVDPIFGATLERMARKQNKHKIGFSVGFVAGIPAAMADLRFFEPFDILSTNARTGVAYAQGTDSAGTGRTHLLLIVDGIYRLSTQPAPGLRAYTGLGFNYNAATSDRKTGAIGGQLFYGVEGGRPEKGQTIFEIGYGAIRTGFSPDYVGITALFGYKF
ncbi:hypothetical protein A3H38_06185 [candidate division WOR-1 bacterium RIFCSPLOWO2_02_FULL_46_20]|uniref:Outer membrane protein beta-barrel domain-containing protein n=2 Tax=Saganbacteria TaxID=1703751 RepID=A0A1F4RBM3_UNCSA|nr:MAG: hypothetical protein A3H38_06185 [candidate division WOR-1 bacterium RIFCSPLOWO2_02_FULL_46_20]OGC09469.1 MAG: hypothetical protein A3F86_02485 [candidate division WOR-1 bacterium RIFCSPLOWO2_12_FULL_45_9]